MKRISVCGTQVNDIAARLYRPEADDLTFALMAEALQILQREMHSQAGGRQIYLVP